MRTSSKLPLPSKQYVRDTQWIIRHSRSLSTKYPNKWVAVHKGRVVAIGDDLGSTKAIAQKDTGELDIPVEFIGDCTIIY